MDGSVLLVGPPNVGKSVIFQRLTGRYAQVSNYPGTTVEITSAAWGKGRLVDTPGIYSLEGGSEEERVTKRILAGASVVVAVVGALTLERDLYLVWQIWATGLPMLLVVNQLDEAHGRGIKPELAALREALGVPVVGTVAVRNIGLRRIAKELPQAALDRRCWPGFGADVLSILEGGQGEETRGACQDYFRRQADDLAAKVTGVANGRRASGGLWLLRPFPGLLVLLLLLIGIYYFLGVVMARVVIDYAEKVLLREFYTPLLQDVAKTILPHGFLYNLLAGPNGVLSVTVAYLLIVLLPLVGSFYFCLGLLEDTGYLPRLVVLLDKSFNRFGLNGKAVIPLILGLGCGTAATVGARTLDSPRERIMVTMLLALAVPCSAQMAVIFGLLAPLGVGYLALYFMLLVVVFGGAGLLGGGILGSAEGLAVALPPLRLPSPANLLRKTLYRTVNFGQEAFPYFFYGGVVMAILEQGRMLTWLENLLRPLTVGWLGLPAAASKAFLLGMLRRDFGAAGLYQLALTPAQTLTAAFTMTLFVPCLPALLVILKERGKAVGLGVWFFTLCIAFFLGGLVPRLLAIL